MGKSRQYIDHINILLGLLIVGVCAYIIYLYLPFSFTEKFDTDTDASTPSEDSDEAVSSPSENTSEEVVSSPSENTSEEVLSSPSEEPEASEGEVDSEVVSSPAEVRSFNKIVKATVPKTPDLMPFNIKSSSPASNNMDNVDSEANSDSPSAFIKHPVPNDPSSLTPKEKQLFDAFLEKRINDDTVQDLITKGTLTEETIEKFLKMIDDLPEGPPVTGAPKKLSKQGIIKNKDDNLLEGFCGNTYARI